MKTKIYKSKEISCRLDKLRDYYYDYIEYGSLRFEVQCLMDVSSVYHILQYVSKGCKMQPKSVEVFLDTQGFGVLPIEYYQDVKKWLGSFEFVSISEDYPYNPYRAEGFVDRITLHNLKEHVGGKVDFYFRDMIEYCYYKERYKNDSENMEFHYTPEIIDGNGVVNSKSISSDKVIYIHRDKLTIIKDRTK